MYLNITGAWEPEVGVNPERGLGASSFKEFGAHKRLGTHSQNLDLDTHLGPTGGLATHSEGWTPDRFESHGEFGTHR